MCACRLRRRETRVFKGSVTEGIPLPSPNTAYVCIFLRPPIPPLPPTHTSIRMMFSLVSGKSAAFRFVIALTVTAHFQLAGYSCYGDEICGESKGGLIACQTYGSMGVMTGLLNVDSKCEVVTTALNNLINGKMCQNGVAIKNPIKCEEYQRLGKYYKNGGLAVVTATARGTHTCGCVVDALNDLNGVSGISCGDGYFNTLYVEPRDQCPAIALALSAHIADEIEAGMMKTFFQVSLPITGVVFVYFGLMAYNDLGGDDNLPATFSFALFVSFRVFDLMSDWGMYSVSLASQHVGKPLRHACMAFSLIGSILLILDLNTMKARAEHWFGITDSSESLKTVGYSMLAIVLLEDVPQFIITSIYLTDVAASGRVVDPVAITSLVLSVISMIANAFIAMRSLC